ncbi:MAG TPA: DUF2336 domain-containing protein [Caulobacteraceae bacterium]|nr:DUF2336 domain-containing protein [Caulobacteraceae bacterium]
MAPEDVEPAEPPPSKARLALLKRLADVVCLPSSRVNAFERSMTCDLLIEILRDATIDERTRVAQRLCSLVDAPAALARLLVRDAIEVASSVLELSTSLGDAELIDCARNATVKHRLLIAARREVSELVCEALVEPMEAPVIEAVLRNETSHLSPNALEILVAATRAHTRMIPLLLRRAELRPSHAYILFWWADADARRNILQRFAMSREVLQEAASDVFSLAVAENWADPLSRKALEFIGRRQRNRAAIENSPFKGLEDAIAAAQRGMTREIAEDISYLSGLKPATVAKIFADAGGEPIAILCKATGLPKAAIKALWRGLRRPETESSGELSPALERVLIIHDMIAVDRAQTVLRYWDWSPSPALTPALLKAIRAGEEDGLDEFSLP